MLEALLFCALSGFVGAAQTETPFRVGRALCAARFALCFAALLLPALALSAVYRAYLLRTKRRLFAAPASLAWLFPQPTDYEAQMVELCQRYLETSNV